MARIIETAHSLVLSPDVEPEVYPVLMEQLRGVEGLGGVKVGFALGLTIGLPDTVVMTRQALPGAKVVYDHQKAGNDIDATGHQFAQTMERAGVDAAILFPNTGPAVQERWTRELKDRGIEVITGSEMTHPQHAAEDGGYIPRDSFERMMRMAVDLGCTNFVVPGNKPESVAKWHSLFEKLLGAGNYDLWAPGFVTQGGDVSETGKVAGERFHAIVGSGIYKAENPREAATVLGQKVLAL